MRGTLAAQRRRALLGVLLLGTLAAAPPGPAPAPVPPVEPVPVAAVAPNRFLVRTARGVYAIPCAWNFPLYQENRRIERAVIVLHGITRDATGYHALLARLAARSRAVEESTAICAPQFLIEEDMDRHTPGADVLFWRGGAWKQGDNSASTPAHPRGVAVSSFEVMDALIEHLAARKEFPRLREIVLAGHSAGGQFVNRYAAGSRVEDAVLRPARIRIRYIVANPSSYLYFTGERRVAGTVDRFAAPSEEARALAPDYDAYPYGLETLNAYMAAVGARRIRTQYAEREVIYLIGDADDQEDAQFLDRTPAAMLQGAQRRERATIYYNYLRHVFGPEISLRHRFIRLPGVGHEAWGVFSPEPVVRYLFGQPPPAATAAATAPGP